MDPIQSRPSYRYRTRRRTRELEERKKGLSSERVGGDNLESSNSANDISVPASVPASASNSDVGAASDNSDISHVDHVDSSSADKCQPVSDVHKESCHVIEGDTINSGVVEQPTKIDALVEDDKCEKVLKKRTSKHKAKAQLSAENSKTSTRPKTDPAANYWWYIFIGFFVLLAAFSISYWSLSNQQLTCDSENRQLMLNSFTDQLSKLEAQFSSQPARLWTIVRASIKSVLRTSQPRQPAIILFVSNSDKTSQLTLQCLANHISQIISLVVSNTSKPVVINGKTVRQHESRSDSDAKLLLDDLLSRGFREGSKAAILTQLENFGSQMALLLHSYCDNENAPYKDKVIMMTLSFSTDDLTMQNVEDQVERFLFQTWSELNNDKKSAILSRIANNVVVVQPENNLSQLNCSTVQ